MTTHLFDLLSPNLERTRTQFQRSGNLTRKATGRRRDLFAVQIHHRVKDMEGRKTTPKRLESACRLFRYS